jgi:hypothetical protein
VAEWFEDHPQFEVLSWPPKGADFNPIGNLWSELVCDMEAQYVRNSDQLWNKVLTEWESLRQRFILASSPS